MQSGQILTHFSYQVRDWTKQWPKDVRNCLASHMSISDILKLSRTAKHWANLIISPSYNDYWKSRYFRDFFKHPLTGPVPKFIKVKPEDHQNRETKLRAAYAQKLGAPSAPPAASPTKKKTKIDPVEMPVLWFDIYQYTHARLKYGHKTAFGRKTLYTFIE